MTPALASPRDNLVASGWLLLDMSLNIWALTIVKATGGDYPAIQLVALRAAMGLVTLAPWIWLRRKAFRHVDRPGLHVLRVALSTVTLASSFYAIARLPFALFTAVNFTRPLLLMLMAALLLREAIRPRRWLYAGIGLTGALIAVGPGIASPSPALLALFVTVFAGTAAIIATRALRGTPPVVMMTFYTLGLAVTAAPFALATWQPVPAGDWPRLLAIGLFAQAGQLCFLRAHFRGDAGVLAPVSYASLVLSTASGYLFFDEVPGPAMILGSALIIAAALAAARDR